MASINAVILLKRTLVLGIIIFLFHPIIFFLYKSGGIDPISVLKHQSFWSALWFTLSQAIISLFLSLIIALPGAYWLSKYRGRSKPYIHAFLAIFLMLPVIFVIIGFISLFGEEGILNKLLFSITGDKIRILYSLPAIITANIFFNIPLIIKIVSRAWEEAGKGEEEAAILLGASKYRIFKSITLPKLFPPIIAVSFIVFIFCFMSFAIPLILGGGPAYSTLEVLIYENVRLTLNLPFAMGVALIELFISVIFFVVCSRFIHRFTFIPPHGPQNIAGHKTSLVFKFYIFIISLFLILPFLSLIIESISGLFTPKIIFSQSFFHSLYVSIIVALASGFLATTFALLISLAIRNLREEKIYDLIFFIPMGLSSLFLGMCYLISYQSLFFRGWGLIVLVILHTTINIPFAFRIIRGSIVKLSPQLWQVAEHLAIDWRVRLRHVTIPLLRNSIVNSFLITAALSLGEFNATMMLAGGRIKTVPIIIYELLGSYRLEPAMIIGLIYTSIAFLIFFIVERRGGHVTPS